MKRAFTSLFRQDLVLSRRNGLLLVTAVTLAVIIALYWTMPLLLPKAPSLSRSLVFLDKTADGALREMIGGTEGIIFAADEKELHTMVREAKNTIGILAEGSLDEISYTLFFNTRPGDRVVRIIQAALKDMTRTARGSSPGSPVTITRLRPEAPPVPANKSMIAILLAFEVMILGFLFVAVVIFGEKKEGSVRAYRVSPSGLGNYVLSKTLVFTIMSMIYGLVMTAATIGFSVNYARLSAVLFSACALMTLLGLGIAAFFRNISEWFVPGVLVLAVNMLALLPYRIPAYSARILTFLPGYTVIFGVNEILFPTGKVGFFPPLMLTLSIQTVLAALFALWSARRNMMKET